MKKNKKIVIFPILPERNSGIAKPGGESAPHIPSLRGFLNEDSSTGKRVPLDILRLVFTELKNIPPGREPGYNALTGQISRSLLEQGAWTWHLPELIKDIRGYLEDFREERLEFEEVEREMSQRLSPILKESGLDRQEIVEELVDQIIRVFNASSNQTSLQEISESLQDTPAFTRLPEEVVDRCVDEFFDILFSRGYISFTDD